MIGRRLLRIKVLQVLYANTKNEGISINNIEKELLFSLEKSNDLFYNILLLLTEIKDHAEHRIELGRNKRFPTASEINPNTKFIENPVLKMLEDNIQFKSYVSSHGLGWNDLQETPRIYFDKLVEESFYKEYMSGEGQTFQDHKKFVIDIISNLLANNEDFSATLEEESIYWNDDLDFVFSMAIKAIKKFKESDDEYSSINRLFSSDDEVEFAKNLLKKTLLKQVELKEIVKNNIVNWDVERIASIDILIMCLALCEIMEFPSIPVKVTFDEYIDMAKYYSTRKSSEFINGVLDKIVNNMIKDEQFVKVGRGLL